jgi:hypothetical protein
MISYAIGAGSPSPLVLGPERRFVDKGQETVDVEKVCVYKAVGEVSLRQRQTVVDIRSAVTSPIKLLDTRRRGTGHVAMF